MAGVTGPERKVLIMRKPLILAVLTALLLILTAGPALAQGSNTDGESVLVRVNGDVTVPSGEQHGVVVVVEGDLDFEGTANTIVVVSGRADLDGATVETLVVVDGSADLGADTTITGDLHLVESDLTRAASATVEGSIERGTGDFSQGFWIVGALFMLGWSIMTVLAALVLAAVAPNFARRTARTITAQVGQTILAALILWIVVPIVGIILFATLIGAPTALTIWFGILPALWLIGLVVAGVRVGELVTGGGDGVGHPYVAAFVGTVILLILGVIPVLGPIVVAIAGFLGSGAIVLQGFRSVLSEPEPPPPSAPVVPMATASTATSTTEL